jgi:hypothetical protein
MGGSEAVEFNMLRWVASASGFRADVAVIATILLATVNDEAGSRKTKIKETRILVRKFLSPRLLVMQMQLVNTYGTLHYYNRDR